MVFNPVIRSSYNTGPHIAATSSNPLCARAYIPSYTATGPWVLPWEIPDCKTACTHISNTKLVERSPTSCVGCHAVGWTPPNDNDKISLFG